LVAGAGTGGSGIRFVQFRAGGYDGPEPPVGRWYPPPAETTGGWFERRLPFCRSGLFRHL
jgi:hypothetical protein